MADVGGRPRKEIDWEEFEKLCALHCTKEEIAAWFECSTANIDNKVEEYYGEGFSTIFNQKKAKGKISLRRKMMSTALNGSVPMQIFMAKNWLGFGDRVVTETAAENEASKLVIDFGEKKE